VVDRNSFPLESQWDYAIDYDSVKTKSVDQLAAFSKPIPRDFGPRISSTGFVSQTQYICVSVIHFLSPLIQVFYLVDPVETPRDDLDMVTYASETITQGEDEFVDTVQFGYVRSSQYRNIHG
jgi:hypothetical protein